MAKRFVLRELEAEYGDLHQVIPKLVNEAGQAYAAHQLNTSQFTISKWLKDNGYKQQVKYVRETKLEAAG